MFLGLIKLVSEDHIRFFNFRRGKVGESSLIKFKYKLIISEVCFDHGMQMKHEPSHRFIHEKWINDGESNCQDHRMNILAIECSTFEDSDTSESEGN